MRTKTLYSLKKIKAKPFSCGETQLEHMYEMETQTSIKYILLPIEHFKEKCILVQVNDTKMFICKFSNTFEVQ